jgi:hypothetical protein
VLIQDLEQKLDIGLVELGNLIVNSYNSKKMVYLDSIEAILYEAHAYGMREEVLDGAKRIMMHDSKIDLKSAYEQAFQSVIINNRAKIQNISN